MFLESFTASAGRALKRADLLARRQNASVVDSLDLLAALAAESESRACELLVELGVEMDHLRAGLGPGISEALAESERVELEADTTGGASLPVALPISPALRRVMNEAMAQARGADRNREVGTEHLLASLLATSGPAAELLRAAGLDLDTLRERLTEATLVDLAPLPLAEGIPPLELSDPGGGADLARILDASVNRTCRRDSQVIEDYVRFQASTIPASPRRLEEMRLPAGRKADMGSSRTAPPGLARHSWRRWHAHHDTVRADP